MSRSVVQSIISNYQKTLLGAASVLLARQHPDLGGCDREPRRQSLDHQCLQLERCAWRSPLELLQFVSGQAERPRWSIGDYLARLRAKREESLLSHQRTRSVAS